MLLEWGLLFIVNSEKTVIQSSQLKLGNYVTEVVGRFKAARSSRLLGVDFASGRRRRTKV